MLASSWAKLETGDGVGAVLDYMKALDGAPAPPPPKTLLAQRDAYFMRAAANPQVVSFEFNAPGAPGVAMKMSSGMTLARAEECALKHAGLTLMNPPKRSLQELYPTWANPRIWTSPAELKAKTGVRWKVRCHTVPDDPLSPRHAVARVSLVGPHLGCVVLGQPKR